MLTFPDRHVSDHPLNRIFSFVPVLAIEIGSELVVLALMN